MSFPNLLKKAPFIQPFKKILKPVYDCTWRRYENSYGNWIRTQESPFVSQLTSNIDTNIPTKLTLFTPILRLDEIEKLSQTIESVRNQTQKVPCWIIATPDAFSADVTAIVGIELQDNIIVVPYKKTEEINTLLFASEASYIGFLEPGDRLTRLASQVVNQSIAEQPDISVFYTDEDHLKPNGKRTDPWLKPEFNIYNLRSANYLRHFLIVKKNLGDEIGWFGYNSDAKVPWYDFALRLADAEPKIYHIPQVLYHNQALRPAAISENTLWEPEVQDRLALQSHLARRKVKTEVLPNNYIDSFRVRYIPRNESLVSILIPNCNQTNLLKRCVDSIREKTDWENYEILIVENNSDEDSIFEYYQSLQKDLDFPGKVLYWPDEFNYSAINNWAAEQAQGDIFVFLNNDTEVISPDWLQEMIGLAQQPDVGAVGAKLLFPDKTIQHVGIGLGKISDQFFFHIAEWMPAELPGYYGWTRKTNAVIAVTGACLMIERVKFMAVGGFDPALPMSFNDVELCLNLYSKGNINLGIPQAKLIHHESKTRGQTITKEQRKTGHNSGCTNVRLSLF